MYSALSFEESETQTLRLLLCTGLRVTFIKQVSGGPIVCTTVHAVVVGRLHKSVTDPRNLVISLSVCQLQSSNCMYQHLIKIALVVTRIANEPMFIPCAIYMHACADLQVHLEYFMYSALSFEESETQNRKIVTMYRPKVTFIKHESGGPTVSTYNLMMWLANTE